MFAKHLRRTPPSLICVSHDSSVVQPVSLINASTPNQGHAFFFAKIHALSPCVMMRPLVAGDSPSAQPPQDSARLQPQLPGWLPVQLHSQLPGMPDCAAWLQPVPELLLPCPAQHMTSMSNSRSILSGNILCLLTAAL
jgi:hypothetical protein